jgi:hypothetical protein
MERHILPTELNLHQQSLEIVFAVIERDSSRWKDGVRPMSLSILSRFLHAQFDLQPGNNRHIHQRIQAEQMNFATH